MSAYYDGGRLISEGYAHQTAVLGARLGAEPVPFCTECDDELPDADPVLDRDGQPVPLICQDCYDEMNTAPTCRQCRTEIEHEELLWCSRSCRDEDYREQRAEMAGDL